MTPLRFYIIVMLCVSYALLSVVDAYLFQSWEDTLAQQKDYQAKASYAEHMDIFTEQLLRRTALAGFNDPPLMEMLKKQGVKIQPVVGTSAPPPASSPPPQQQQQPPPADTATIPPAPVTPPVTEVVPPNPTTPPPEAPASPPGATTSTPFSLHP